MLLKRNTKIYPYKHDQLATWAERWGISSNDITEAMLSTGSIRANVLKSYLMKKGLIFSYTGVLQNLRIRFKNFIHKWNDEEEF